MEKRGPAPQLHADVTGGRREAADPPGQGGLEVISQFSSKCWGRSLPPGPHLGQSWPAGQGWITGHKGTQGARRQGQQHALPEAQDPSQMSVPEPGPHG